MGDAQDDEERKRQRRERAAAWAAQQALNFKSEEAAAPSTSSAPLRGSLRWVRGGDLPKETDSSQVKEETSVGNKRQRTGWDSGQGKEAATPGDSGWMCWASSEGGGRREADLLKLGCNPERERCLLPDAKGFRLEFLPRLVRDDSA